MSALRSATLFASALLLLAVPASAGGRAYVHDGFHLQGQLGFGYLTSSYDFDVAGTRYDVDVKGYGLGGGLLIGGATSPGFIVGGTWQTAIAVNPTADSGLSSVETEGTRLQLHLLGLALDFFPSPRQGLHLQAALGFAMLQGKPFQGVDPKGAGFSFGVGNQWWVSSDVGVGVLARVIYAPVSDGGLSFTTWSPGIFATVTYD